MSRDLRVIAGQKPSSVNQGQFSVEQETLRLAESVNRMIQQGMSQRAIAKALGVSQPTISRLSNIEPGEINSLLGFMGIALMRGGPERRAALKAWQQKHLTEAELAQRSQREREYAAYETWRREHHCGMCDSDDRIRELHCPQASNHFESQ
jgi:hypothetical protein